ncbi:unnamed protein product [Symbiodinium sp. CCMP2592]|nr:unnamed protein product [Symbiodinium sp. CCMP2592]
MQMRRWLWSQVSATDSGLSLTTKDTRRIGLVSVQALTTYRHGPANEEACWLGVLALQFWGLLMQFPQIHPYEFEVDWRLFASADWTLVLLSEFPIFGLLHQAQQAIQSCEMFAVGTTRLPGGHRTCPLPRCDLQDDAEGLGLEEVQRAQLFFDMLVNSALAGEAVFMVTLPRVPRCPLGQAAQELAFAVVDAVRYGAGAWRQISRSVMSAKSRMMKWLQGDLPQAPQSRDELGNISTADPLSEVLASRWNVLGLLHALQVVLRRSVDSHPHIQLPWLVAEGPRGLDLLADTSSLRGSFARYLLANLRREFWGGGRGVEHLVARVLHEGRCHPTEPRVFVDVGALCHAHECLSKILLAETARKCGGRSGRIFVDALEPNARNFRSTKAQLLRLPRRWHLRLRLRRAAAGNTTMRATLHGTGAKASLKAEAYGGLSWSFKPSMGKIVSSADGRKEQVSVIRLDSWVGARLRTHGRVEVLKIDVEGGEWEVLLGAEALLVERRVLCVVLEYSHFWAASTHVTLKGLARWMSERGYDGYLVGSPHLIPVSGVDMEWWHDLYEVCAAPDSRIYRGLAGWCWLNAAFVLRGSRLALAAQKWLPKMGKKVFEGAEGKCYGMSAKSSLSLVSSQSCNSFGDAENRCFKRVEFLVRPVAMACSPRAALQEDAEGSCSDGEEEISPWSLWCEEAEQGVWPRDFAFLLRSRSRSPRRRPGRPGRSVEDAPATESPPRLPTLKLERPWRQVLSSAPFAHAAAQPSQQTAPLLQEEGECRECRARPRCEKTWRDEGTPHAFGEGYKQKTFLATLTANPLLCKAE